MRDRGKRKEGEPGLEGRETGRRTIDKGKREGEEREIERVERQDEERENGQLSPPSLSLNRGGKVIWWPGRLKFSPRSEMK